MKFVWNANILNIGTMDICNAKTAQRNKSTISTKKNVIIVQYQTLTLMGNIVRYAQITKCTIGKLILAKIVLSTRSTIMWKWSVFALKITLLALLKAASNVIYQTTLISQRNLAYPALKTKFIILTNPNAFLVHHPHLSLMESIALNVLTTLTLNKNQDNALNALLTVFIIKSLTNVNAPQIYSLTETNASLVTCQNILIYLIAPANLAQNIKFMTPSPKNAVIAPMLNHF